MSTTAIFLVGLFVTSLCVTFVLVTIRETRRIYGESSRDLDDGTARRSFGESSRYMTESAESRETNPES